MIINYVHNSTHYPVVIAGVFLLLLRDVFGFRLLLCSSVWMHIWESEGVSHFGGVIQSGGTLLQPGFSPCKFLLQVINTYTLVHFRGIYLSPLHLLNETSGKHRDLP